MAYADTRNCKDDGLRVIFTNYTEQEVARIKKAVKSFEISISHKKMFEISDKLYIFNNINKDDIIKITKNVKFKRHKKGDIVIQEGKKDNQVYFILYGSCAIVSKGNVVATIKSGYMFGEMSFLTKAPRSATVIVHKEGTTLLSFEINEDKFSQKYALSFAMLYKNMALDLSNKLKKSNLKKLSNNI